MNYKKIISNVPCHWDTEEKEREADGFVKEAYQVFEKDEMAAEFSYYTETVKDRIYRGAGEVRIKQFWIDEIRLSDEFENYRTMDAVIQFIQYKCWAAGCPAMYVRLSSWNLLYQEMYMKYGFSVIAEEEKKLPRGGRVYEYIMKYSLPDSREAEYRNYIRRKTRNHEQ